MASPILKLAEDKYVEWSSITDSPTTSIMSKLELVSYLNNLHSLEEKLLNETDPRTIELKKELVATKIKHRLERVESKGTSSLIPGDTMENTVAGNRAGPNETEISLSEIIELYTYSPEKRGKFPFS